MNFPANASLNTDTKEVPYANNFREAETRQRFHMGTLGARTGNKSKASSRKNRSLAKSDGKIKEGLQSEDCGIDQNRT